MNITNLEEAFQHIKGLENQQLIENTKYEVEKLKLEGGIERLQERIKEKDGIISDLKDVISVFKPKKGEEKKNEKQS